MSGRIGAWLRRFKPRTLGGRIFLTLLVGGAVLVVYAAGTAGYLIARERTLFAAQEMGVTIWESWRDAEIRRRAGQTPAAMREGAVRLRWQAVAPAALRAGTVQWLPLPIVRNDGGWPKAVAVHVDQGSLTEGQLRDLQQRGTALRYLSALSREVARLGVGASLELRLADDSVLIADSPTLWRARTRPSVVVVLAALALGAIFLLFSTAAQKLAGPFCKLADTINKGGMDGEGPAAVERGPTEARAMARTYNELRSKLTRTLQEKTRMLAAISHDLRTPSTRLRLRTEFIADDDLRATMLRDLDEMDLLLSETLELLNEAAQKETVKVVEFTSLLQSLCDDYADLGRPVVFEGPPALKAQTVPTLFGRGGSEIAFDQHRVIRIACRPGRLRRAFANLIENAIKYGGRARVAMDATAEQVSVHVYDRGAGIPKDQWDKVFLPFYRIEGSRARTTGGSGLGLAIVKSIVDAHQGQVSLGNRPEGGLCVTVELPRRDDSDAV